MDINFEAVYYEPQALEYPLGQMLHKKYQDLPWVEIASHNRIPELSRRQNSEFPRLKRNLIVGVRKTHRYTENHKVSDWLVPYTSSGCRAMCLYCYLVCNYNKCAYLRLFVNREYMLEKLLKADANSTRLQTFEIGSNSDLVLENAVTDNLIWTIEQFAKAGKGKLTFPTKFDMVQPLLGLEHKGRTIFRMSVNPAEIIRRVELGTSPLDARIRAVNAMAEAGYPVGLLIAPVILLPQWKQLYSDLLDILAQELSNEVKLTGFIEVILMTYSYVQDAINTDAFPNALPIFDRSKMTGRGRGKYCYRNEIRQEAEAFLRNEIKRKLDMPIVYFA